MGGEFFTKKCSVSDFMTANVIVAGENNSFEQVMTFFTVHKIQHLPVAENNKLIGIVSMKDMLSFIAHQLNDNPMISKEVGQKNNPLNSKNTVSKVEKQLINIGFNLNETI